MNFERTLSKQVMDQGFALAMADQDEAADLLVRAYMLLRAAQTAREFGDLKTAKVRLLAARAALHCHEQALGLVP